MTIIFMIDKVFVLKLKLYFLRDFLKEFIKHEAEILGEYRLRA